MKKKEKQISLKKDWEIEIMIEGGKKLRRVIKQLIQEISVGKTTNDIDKKAEFLIKREGGEPSFKRVKNYFWSTCLSINEQIVHTPPSERFLKEGDILTVDLGVYYQGYHTDWATTIIIGNHSDKEKEQFLNAGEITLEKAIAQFKIGNRIGHVSQAIEESLRGFNYYPIEELTGHGIGKELHENPYVPGFLVGSLDETEKIKNGLVVAIEIIYSQKKTRIKYEKRNHWSLITENGSLSACFEKTVAIYKNKPLILT